MVISNDDSSFSDTIALSRDKASATTFDFPVICVIVKSNSAKKSSHLACLRDNLG